MKTLKPGPRPFIALGVVCGLLFLVVLGFGLSRNNLTGVGPILGGLLIFPAVFIGTIVFVRVEVDDKEIRQKNFGFTLKRVRFEEINHAYGRYLVEKDWPVSLAIIGKDGATELMTLRLKVFKKADVSWLLGLPALKIKRH